MKVYLTPPQPSRGLQRIADALVRYAPEWVEVVPTQAQAELVIIYAIGRRERVTNLADYLVFTDRKYAIIQVCLKSTMAPNPWDWVDIWRDAEVVWSYYDLEAALSNGEYMRFAKFKLDNFYHAPLGADAEMFVANSDVKKLFTVATSGESRLSESVRECWLAVKEIGGHAYHVGPRLSTNASVVFSNGNSDLELCASYQQCEFVSGLRRKEGFELPAVEGLLCGSRPICFNTPDYRWNYGNHAIYIEETDRQGVIDQLVQLFKHGAPPVTPEERELAVARYNWETIIGGFYDRLSN